MSPNRRVKDLIRISLFGCNEKTQILQGFVNNKIESSTDNKQFEDEYIVDIEIHNKLIQMMLIDIDTRNTDNSDKRKELYHRASNIIYFFDNSNQSTSYNKLNQIYKEAKEIWKNDIKLVLVNCVDSNSSSPKINSHKISNEYKCEIFEIDSNKNIENIN